MSKKTLTQPRQNRLSEPVRRFIVTGLGRFDTPSQVAVAVKETFGIEVTRQQVEAYNPLRAGDKPAKKWCQLFEATRKAFLTEVASVGIAHQAVRYHRLETLYWEAKKRGNIPLAAALLEQAAKEDGSFWSNKRNLKLNRPGFVGDSVT